MTTMSIPFDSANVHVFPGCPTCGHDVTSTDITSGVQAEPPWSGSTTNAQREQALEPFRADEVPPGWVIRSHRGAPSHDVLTFRPCGHTVQGDAVHVYKLAALNLSYPNLEIEIRVVVPSWATEDQWPRLLAHNLTYGAGEILTYGTRVADAIGDRITKAAAVTAGMVAGTLGQ